MPVVFVGIAGARPGLVVFMKGNSDRVLYTVGETVSANNQSFSPQSIVCIDTALEEIC